MAQWLATVRKTATIIGDALVPPLCPGCKAGVMQHGAMCSACWGKLNFIGNAKCVTCGLPFDVVDGADGLSCEGCMREPPVFSRARAPLIYDDASRDLIMRLKHGDQHHIVPAFVPFMRLAGSELLARADILVPVPLSRWRLFRRRYNQAALLALALSTAVQKQVCVDALLRTRNTPSQGEMDRKQRQRNMRDAFALNPRYADRIKDKTIVLIDDVLTSGATANECARVLLKAGAARVDVLILARVPLY